MKKLILLAAPFLLFSCNTRHESESTGILTEKAIVVTLIHSPSEHKTELKNTAFHNDGLMGQDWEGNSGIRIGEDLQISSTTIPEKFGVAFQCEHGTFTVEGSETKHKVLYEKLLREVGDTVNILFKENYYVTYTKGDDGKETMTSRVLNKLDFIDAQK